jgi:hypothetical protein
MGIVALIILAAVVYMALHPLRTLSLIGKLILIALVFAALVYFFGPDNSDHGSDHPAQHRHH